MASGARSFVFNYTVKATGQQRRMTLGPTTMGIDAARTVVAVHWARIALGGDPMAEQQASQKQAKLDRATAETANRTVADLIDGFLADHLPKLARTSQSEYRRQLETIRRRFGKRPADSLTSGDAIDYFDERTRTGKISANRGLAVLSSLFTFAVRKRLVEPRCHPVRGALIQRHKEQPRDRFLTDDELHRLLAAIDSLDPEPADAIRLLLLTGSRKSEVLEARWADIDDRGRWRKRKTKNGKIHSTTLFGDALALIERRRAARLGASPWVFPAPEGRGHRKTIRRPFLAALAAGIERDAEGKRFRIHDLRHSYASFLADAGLSLFQIGQMLNHSSPSMTQRYAHLTDKVSEQAAAAVAHAMRPAGSSRGAVVEPRETPHRSPDDRSFATTDLH